MSGTASRFQMRFGYAPGLRVGQYPGAAPAQPAMPAPGAVGPSLSAPLLSFPTTAPVMAPAPSPVMAGSMDPERMRSGQDGAGGSAQGDYGGPGPSGIGSTGSVLGDIAGFANEAGRAALGMGTPMGLAGTVAGVLGAGIVNAFGYPETAEDIAQAVGFASGPDSGGPKGGYSATDIGAPFGGWGDQTGSKPDALGGDGGTSGSHGGTSTGSSNDPGGFGGVDAGSGYGDAGGYGDSGAGDSAGDSNGGTSTGSSWMRGGFTGHGHPAEQAGIVHRNEVVIPAQQVARYGLDPLLMLVRGQVQPSRLAALMTGGGPR